MKDMKYVDLSLVLTQDIPVFPGESKAVFKHAYIDKNNYNAHQITINTHFGTHVDFPYHIIDSGKKSNEFGIEKFIGKGKVIDIRKPDLNILDEDVFLIYTGHIEKGIDKLFEDLPQIDEKLIEYLILKKPKMILFDIPTPDSVPFPIHKALLQEDILIVENVCNMKKLEGKKFKIYALPLNFNGFDGSPCRVFAEVEE